MAKDEKLGNVEHTCKNCGKVFIGNYCPECGQSVKEFERPFQFMVIDFMGNMFAFDTRFWKTLGAILFKPGKLALDYVKGHRVRYMPPFRFYVFISFIFFFLLNDYTTQNTKLSPGDGKKIVVFGSSENTDSLNVADSTKAMFKIKSDSGKKQEEEATKKFFNEHPEIFAEKLLTNLSWAMFFLMPLYGFFLWIFYRKSQKYYITHFLLAINQHSFMFVVLSVILLLTLFLPEFTSPYRYYLLLLIPIYFVYGHKILYQQKLWKTIFKFMVIGAFYTFVILAASIGLILLVAVQNGISLG